MWWTINVHNPKWSLDTLVNGVVPLEAEGLVLCPSLSYASLLRDERRLRMSGNGYKVRARNIFFWPCSASLGVSPHHYNFFLLAQFFTFCHKNGNVRIEGLDQVPKGSPLLFVMKHRGYADITLHGMAHALLTSSIHQARPVEDNFLDVRQLRRIIAASRPARFIMKDELLLLPIGLHLLLNGGIPVMQDLETKAKNTPGFDPNAEKVKDAQAMLAGWSSFKESYREIISVLKGGGSIMLYGEATRVHGDHMGHLSTKFMERLVKSIDGLQLIPVGSVWRDGKKILRYGRPCGINDLRNEIARLSEIPADKFLS